MEHRLITGGAEYLPFARSRIKALKATGLEYASQRFDIGGVSVGVRIAGDQEFITLSGNPGKLWVLVTAWDSVPYSVQVPKTKLYRLDTLYGVKAAKLLHSGSSVFILDTPGPAPLQIPMRALPGSTAVYDFVPYGDKALILMRYAINLVDIFRTGGPQPISGALVKDVSSTIKMMWGKDFVNSKDMTWTEKAYYMDDGSGARDTGYYVNTEEGEKVANPPSMLAPGLICYSMDTARGGASTRTFMKLDVAKDDEAPSVDPEGVPRPFLFYWDTYHLYKVPDERTKDEAAYARRETGNDAQGHDFIYHQSSRTFYDRRWTSSTRKTASREGVSPLSDGLYLSRIDTSAFGVFRISKYRGDDPMIGSIDMKDLPGFREDPYFMSAVASSRIAFHIKADPGQLFTPGVTWK